MRRIFLLAAALPVFAWAAPAYGAATTTLVSSTPLPGGAERLEYRYGPLEAAPGQNLIMLGPVTVEKPPGEGFVTRVEPGVERPGAAFGAHPDEHVG